MRGKARSATRYLLVVLAATWVLLPVPALAHGENDARPIAKNEAVGPYRITLWQVIGDHGSALSAHVVVDFGDVEPAQGEAVLVAVEADESAESAALTASRSEAVGGMWQTADAVGFGDVIRVGVAGEHGQWWSSDLTVPPPPGETLLAKVAFALVVFVSTVILLWMIRRARHVWARPTTPLSVTAS